MVIELIGLAIIVAALVWLACSAYRALVRKPTSAPVDVVAEEVWTEADDQALADYRDGYYLGQQLRRELGMEGF
ncbi:hypothetical protein [Lysinibacillus fusiformis]|uniref:hypothetical protein n=1 Tax=Lysinibacillus fusiformis TaxID=28031 RepID=UPI003D02042B